MPVSSGLQKYFDSKRKKSGGMQKKFESIADQIDPAFIKSFEVFHSKIMNIVGEDTDVEDLVMEELSSLDMKMQNVGRKHNLQKAAALINIVEEA